MIVPVQGRAKVRSTGMDGILVVLDNVNREAEEQQRLPHPDPKCDEGRHPQLHPAHARLVTREVQPVKRRGSAL
jgi:hypothetical protein